jgi:hypothetical protein
MNTLSKILIGVLIAVIGVFVILWQMSGCEKKKLTQQVYDCRHAPVKIDTVVKIVKVTDSIWLHPKEVVRWKTEFIHDSVPAKYCDKFYSDTYKYVKGTLVGKIGYEVRSKDCSIDIRFPEIQLPVQYITKMTTVDTCIDKGFKPKYGLGIGVLMNNFKSFPVFKIGGLAVFKKVAISPEGLYNPADQRFYAGATFYYLFGK